MIKLTIFCCLGLVSSLALVNSEHSHFLLPTSQAFVPPLTDTTRIRHLPSSLYPAAQYQLRTAQRVSQADTQTLAPWANSRNVYREQLVGSWILLSANNARLAWQGIVLTFDRDGMFIQTNFHPRCTDCNSVSLGQVEYDLDATGLLQTHLLPVRRQIAADTGSSTGRRTLLYGASLRLSGDKLLIRTEQGPHAATQTLYSFVRLPSSPGSVKGTWLRQPADNADEPSDCRVNNDGSFQFGREGRCSLFYVLNNTLIDISLTDDVGSVAEAGASAEQNGTRLSRVDSHEQTLTVEHIAFDSDAYGYSEGSTLQLQTLGTPDLQRLLTISDQTLSSTPQSANNTLPIARILSLAEQADYLVAASAQRVRPELSLTP